MTEESALVGKWNLASDETHVDASTIRLGVSLASVCNGSIPQVSDIPQKRKDYWWSEEIAALRKISMRARRAYLHT